MIPLVLSSNEDYADGIFVTIDADLMSLYSKSGITI